MDVINLLAKFLSMYTFCDFVFTGIQQSGLFQIDKVYVNRKTYFAEKLAINRIKIYDLHHLCNSINIILFYI